MALTRVGWQPHHRIHRLQIDFRDGRTFAVFRECFLNHAELVASAIVPFCFSSSTTRRGQRCGVGVP
jgi:hypothetical protein